MTIQFNTVWFSGFTTAFSRLIPLSSANYIEGDTHVYHADGVEERYADALPVELVDDCHCPLGDGGVLRVDKVPARSDSRVSGLVEHHADAVVFLVVEAGEVIELSFRKRLLRGGKPHEQGVGGDFALTQH